MEWDELDRRRTGQSPYMPMIDPDDLYYLGNNWLMSLKSFKTPLRYPGGKSRACKKMEPFFPDLRDYEVYYEPFLGGGSVALHITKNILI